jgi:hypothetical protein
MSDLLQRLARLDRTKVFLVALVVGLVALFLPGLLGALMLLAVVVLLVSLLRLTWPVTAPGSQMLRVLIIGILIGIAFAKLL